MAETTETHRGRQFNQKMKPVIVLSYLRRNTDEDHVSSAKDIIDYLRNDCGITADRRSIYSDIAEITGCRAR